MTGDTTRAGTRIGDWFIWIETEIAKTANHRKIPMASIRDAVKGGDIIAEVVATREMAKELRLAADAMERVIDTAEGKPILADANGN